MSKALATKNVAAVLVAVAMVVTFAFAFATPAKADMLSDLQTQVQALLAQIASLQGGSTSSSCAPFTQNLQVGVTGGEVMAVQKFLNTHGAVVSTTGAGSPGNESSYFGAKTKAAVAKWQAANGVSPAAGYWGPISRAKANTMCTSTGPVVTPTGPGLSVFAGSQPANSLAPSGASRVPFTTFTLTNNSGAAVTVTGVTVQRTGLGADGAFSGVMLVDSNGSQIGVSRTFDANHMTTVGETMTLQAGQSVTLTVAGSMTTTNASSYAGQVLSLAVTGISTSAPVTGSLPITGAQQTFNSTLSLGTVTTGVSSFDPASATNKPIGSTGVKFSGIRFTAGSAEDVKFFSIRWRTNGSASPSDLANVMTVVNGTSYPTTLSADGRYYTSVFPGGILMQKGNSVDAYVQGDLVGSNSASRVIEFDLDKTSDVYFVGQTYGYGITPTLNGSCTTLLTGATHATCLSAASGGSAPLQPWLQGSTVSIQGGTVTTIQNAPSVPSQNIAVNVANQVLGGFQTNFSGEAVTVQGMRFLISGNATTTTTDLTSISIVDENGSVVAGPVDASAGVANFTSSVTFPVGLKTYTIKGRLPSAAANGGTIQLNTTPSSWTSPQGQLTGNTITISTANFTMNTMTVRGAYLAVAAGTNPSSQSVVKGGQNVLVGTVQLDASQSGEDVRLSSFPAEVAEVSGTPNADLNNCQIWDGTTALNTGSNVVNTVNVSTDDTVFTFDNALTVTKGTVKTLNITCNLSSSATNDESFKFGVNTSPTVTGVQSGNSVTGANLVVSTGTFSGTMTVSGGASVAVTVDSSSPSYQVAAAGTTGVTLGVIKVRATNENFNMTKLGLTTTGSTLGTGSTGSGNAATAAGDLTTVYLYSSSGTLLGTATFVGTNSTATSTLSNPLSITRDQDTLITVKADLAQIGVSASGGIGNLVKVNPLNFEGTGANSGTTVRGGASTGVAGVRIFKSYPTLALGTLPSTGVADGRLMRFTVSANAAGSVGLSHFTFTVSSTTGVTITTVRLKGYTDSSYSNPISGQGSGGQIGNDTTSIVSGTAFDIMPNVNTVVVPASQTYYFELTAAVSGVDTGDSIVTVLNGDSAYGTNFLTGRDVASALVASTSDASNFVWSGNSTTTSSIVGAVDFSNGYSIPGLPSGGLIQTRSN